VSAVALLADGCQSSSDRRDAFPRFARHEHVQQNEIDVRAGASQCFGAARHGHDVEFPLQRAGDDEQARAVVIGNQDPRERQCGGGGFRHLFSCLG